MKKRYKNNLLKYKIFLLFVLVALVLDIAIVGISYIMYTKNINYESEKICTGISEAMASSLNGNRVDDWLSGQRISDYEETQQQLVNILNSYSDIINIKVYKMNLDGPRVIYDLSRINQNTQKLGTTLEYSGALAGIKNKLISGEYVGTTFSEIDGETVVTAISPVTDVSNKVRCYAICEIGMTTMENNRNNLIKTLFPAILITSVLLVICLNIYINRSVTGPIARLDSILRNMTGAHRAEEVIKDLEKLKDCRLWEVTYLCDGFIDILGDIKQRNDEAEAFEDVAREKMFRAINGEEEPRKEPEKQPKKVIVKIPSSRKKIIKDKELDK